LGVDWIFEGAKTMTQRAISILIILFVFTVPMQAAILNGLVSDTTIYYSGASALLADSTNAHNNVESQNVAVPEPASFMLLLIGIALLASSRAHRLRKPGGV
jgi:hypothetical protein